MTKRKRFWDQNIHFSEGVHIYVHAAGKIIAIHIFLLFSVFSVALQTQTGIENNPLM